MSMASEFKQFALKGNVVDLAVGVIIGAAFGKIVASFVDNLVMPPLGVLLSGRNFSELAFEIGRTADGMPVLLKYGAFLQTALDFLIIAVSLFIAIKAVNRLRSPPTRVVSPPPPRSEVLLEEIRDLLKK